MCILFIWCFIIGLTVLVPNTSFPVGITSVANGTNWSGDGIPIGYSVNGLFVYSVAVT